MIYQEIPLIELNEHWKLSHPSASVTLYLQQPNPEVDVSRKFPCVVICPGGAYHIVSRREAEPVALCFAAQGYSVAVLNYSTDRCFPTQLCELSLVMAMLREKAETFCLNPEQIAVCGFSAGGHLAASLCNLWELSLIREKLHIPHGTNRPNGAILSYPVISSGEFAHQESFQRLLQGFEDTDILPLLSLENSVNVNCPPTFLWHTAEDTAVPVENALLYAMALHRYQIPMEMHIYPNGPHGLSLASHITTPRPSGKNRLVAGWIEQAVRFLDDVFGVNRWQDS